MPAELTLYSRPGCHLCERMLGGLAALRAEGEFVVTEVDISGDPTLEARYGRDIPVLTAGSRELCRHVLDAAAVRAHLADFR